MQPFCLMEMENHKSQKIMLHYDVQYIILFIVVRMPLLSLCSCLWPVLFLRHTLSKIPIFCGINTCGTSILTFWTLFFAECRANNPLRLLALFRELGKIFLFLFLGCIHSSTYDTYHIWCIWMYMSYLVDSLIKNSFAVMGICGCNSPWANWNLSRDPWMKLTTDVTDVKPI